VHKSVLQDLRVWSDDPNHRVFAQRVVARFGLLMTGTREEVRCYLRSASMTSIRGKPGLFELGPKQKLGGAPRIIFAQKADAIVLLASGVETGSRGVKRTIELAGERWKVAARMLSDDVALKALGFDLIPSP